MFLGVLIEQRWPLFVGMGNALRTATRLNLQNNPSVVSYRINSRMITMIRSRPRPPLG